MEGDEYSVTIDGRARRALEDQLLLGPVTPVGKRRITEGLVDTIDGRLTVTVRSREHAPPHFHVAYQGKAADFSICSCEPLHDNALKREYETIRRWHHEFRGDLIRAWNESRPSACPVGPVDCP